MRKTKIWKLVSIVGALMLIFLLGLIKYSTNNRAVSVPAYEFDRFFNISIPNEFVGSTEKSSALVVTNISEFPIAFDSDFGLLLYVLDMENASALVVDNNMHYSAEFPIILPPQDQENHTLILLIDPELSGISPPVRLLVILRGRLVRDGVTSEEIAASQIVIELDK